MTYSTDFRQLALSKIKQGQSIYKVAKEMGNSGLTLNQYGIASPWLKENDSLRCWSTKWIGSVLSVLSAASSPCPDLNLIHYINAIHGMKKVVWKPWIWVNWPPNLGHPIKAYSGALCKLGSLCDRTQLFQFQTATLPVVVIHIIIWDLCKIPQNPLNSHQDI